jgi:kynurenine 3-monooxygenase
LNRILLEKAGLHPNIELHFNSEVISTDPDKRVVSLNSVAASGREVSYDLLFGADGAGSPVRSSLHSFSDIGYRQEMLGHGYKELSMPASADGSFVLEPEALHIWPRGTYMLIALPNMDKTFTCTLFLPFDGEPGFDQLKEESQISAFFGSQFQDAVPLIPSLLTDFMTNPTGRLGTVRCDKWTYGDTALILGDAAHAIVPFFGQGMNCAFEDVSVLAEMLDEGNHQSWSDLLHEFEKERIANTNAIADMALTNYIEMRDLVSDPAFRLRRSLALELEKRFPERFIPKYSLVSFHRVPYKQAQEIGRRQDSVLKTLCEGKQGIAEIDWGRAETLVAELGAMNWAR